MLEEKIKITHTRSHFLYSWQRGIESRWVCLPWTQPTPDMHQRTSLGIRGERERKRVRGQAAKKPICICTYVHSLSIGGALELLGSSSASIIYGNCSHQIVFSVSFLPYMIHGRNYAFSHRNSMLFSVFFIPLPPLSH